MIKINDKWALEADTNCFKLLKRVESKKKKESYAVIGYYGQIKHLLEGMVNHEVMDEVFAGSLEHIDEVLEEIKSKVQELSEIRRKDGN